VGAWRRFLGANGGVPFGANVSSQLRMACMSIWLEGTDSGRHHVPGHPHLGFVSPQALQQRQPVLCTMRSLAAVLAPTVYQDRDRFRLDSDERI
jgi:hypothetical protein